MSAETDSAPRRSLLLLIALGLVTLSAAVFGQVRAHEFVDYDDILFIVKNPRLDLGLTFDSVVAAFKPPYYYHLPLSILSQLLTVELFGRGPAGFHLVNVAYHALSSLLLFFAFLRMTGAVGRSAFVAAVFAIHPLHVETVASASELKGVLSGLFWSLGLYAWARYAERPSATRYMLVGASLALGLLAKASIVTFPFVLLLLDYWPLGRMRGDRALGLAGPGRIGRLALEKTPLLALSALASVTTFLVYERSGHTRLSYGDPLSLPLRLMNALDSYGAYIAQIFWPSGLSIFYPYPPEATLWWRGSVTGLAVLLVTGVALRLARTRPYLPVGWLWFLGTLVPFLGIVQIWEYARADRYSYLPLSGLAIIVAWGASDLAGSRRRAPLAGVGLAAVFGLALVAWIQVGHWRNTTALFEHALAVTDDNFFAHHRLGANYLLQGRLQEAKPHFAEVFRLKPHWAQPRLQLAVLTEKLGDLEDAIALYEEAVAIDPDEATARGALGVALVRARRLADAVPHLEYAAARFPSSAMLPEALADAYFELGRPEEAIRSGEQALANAEARGERALAEQIRRGLTRYREGRPGENDGRDDPRASSR